MSIIIIKNILANNEKVYDTDKVLFAKASYANVTTLTQRMSNALLYPSNSSLIRALHCKMMFSETVDQIDIMYEELKFIFRTTLNIIRNVFVTVQRNKLIEKIMYLVLSADESSDSVTYRIELMTPYEYTNLSPLVKKYYCLLSAIVSMSISRSYNYNINNYQVISIVDDPIMKDLYMVRVFSHGVRIIEGVDYDIRYL